MNWLATLSLVLMAPYYMPQEQGNVPQLLNQFQNPQYTWQQIEAAKKIVALHDPRVLSTLAPDLKDPDRRRRANAAFIFASLGDDQGFKTLDDILTDKSARPRGEITAGNWTLKAQIASDRYYAVYVLGEIKNPRAVPALLPLLHDKDVNYAVPTALAKIGDKRAIAALIKTLGDPNPSMRVLAIDALEQAGSKEALPRLHELVNDKEKSNFGNFASVGDTARAAIAKLESAPN